MGKLSSCCLLLCTSSFAAWGAQPSSGIETEAIRSVVARYMHARNHKDAAAARALFTPDADQLVSSGKWRRGVDQLVRGAMASSNKEAGNSSIAIQSIRLLDPEIAIVDGRYQTTSSSGRIRKMWTTLVLKRVGRNWRIAAIRNMLPAPY